VPSLYYRIELNEIPKSFADSEQPLAVTPKSPLKLRREVERFAIYFRREFNYDFQQFEATEKPSKPHFVPYAAYLFANGPNSYPRIWVGACCFRWREYTNVKPRWAAQWIWLHPYYRGKGILSRAWDKFHKLHGNFYNEPPHSPAMEAFLRKRGKCSLCWQKLDALEGTICNSCEAEHAKQAATT
jgi:hypothetical protein